MKKYWKSVSLLILSVFILSIYYIDIHSYSNRLPEFSFHTVKGDEKAIEPMYLLGDLSYSLLGFETFKVNAEGTEYLRDQSYLERLDGMYMSERIKQLQKEYRSFMRGKETHPDFFFEDDQMLAYTNETSNQMDESSSQLKVDILNKDSGERYTFEINIPSEYIASYMEVAGIKIVEDKLYIIVKHEEDTGDNFKQLVQQYKVDIQKESVIEKKVIYKGSSQYNANGYSDTHLLLNENPENTEYILIDFMEKYEEYDETTGDIVNEAKTVIKSVQAVNMITGEKQEIEFPKENTLPIAIIDNLLYAGDFQKDKLHLMSYNIQNSKVVEEKEIELGNVGLKYIDLMYQRLVHDGKFYAVSLNYEEEILPTIAVIDLKEMQVDYLGKVEMKEGENGYKDPKQGMNPYEIYFGNVEITLD